MINWENFDKTMSEDLIDSRVVSGLLLAQIVVLHEKNLINPLSKYVDIQQQLLARYDVKYSLVDIENECLCLFKQEEFIEIEEDFYEGY